MEKKGIKKICYDLKQSQRKAIVIEVAHRGQLAAATIYRYLSGGALPQFLYQKLICEVLNEILKTSYTIEDLWPDE